MSRPTDLASLWSWALREHDQAARSIPGRIHAKFYAAGDHPGKAPPGIIRGLPFGKAFVRYLDADLDLTACRRALRKMRSHGRVQSDEYLIAFAAVEVGHDMELTRVLMRRAWPSFRDAAMRGLATLWDLTQTEMPTSGQGAVEPPTVRVRDPRVLSPQRR